MKKLNNKGFTLVELLAVVVILVIIMLVAIPNISSSIERRKIKNETKMKEVIIDASESYVDRITNLYWCDKKKCIMSVSDLVDAGYLVKNEVKDYMGYCFIYDSDTKKIDSDNFNADICNNSEYIECSSTCTPPQ